MYGVRFHTNTSYIYTHTYTPKLTYGQQTKPLKSTFKFQYQIFELQIEQFSDSTSWFFIYKILFYLSNWGKINASIKNQKCRRESISHEKCQFKNLNYTRFWCLMFYIVIYSTLKTEILTSTIFMMYIQQFC